MGTTLTLEDDAAVQLKAAARHRPFKVVVNEALRAGLAALEKRAPARKAYRTRGFNLGPSLIGSLDNVEEVLSRVEGERHRHATRRGCRSPAMLITASWAGS